MLVPAVARSAANCCTPFTFLTFFTLPLPAWDSYRINDFIRFDAVVCAAGSPSGL